MNVISMATSSIRKIWAFLLFGLAIAMLWIAYLWRDGPLPPAETALRIQESLALLGPFAILLDVILIGAVLYGIKRSMESHSKDG
ncbi:MAG: hypothetical protein CL398_00060 [Acidiferrobacteraceae bacterium]|nr:hypothetical protein [Acidiferrobacteraceae bacterium]